MRRMRAADNGRVFPVVSRRRWASLLLIYTVVTIFFTLVSYLVVGVLAGQRYGLKDSLRWHGTRLYVWAALSPLVISFARRYRIDPAHWGRPVLCHFAASVGWSLLHVSVNFPLFWFLASTRNQSMFPSFSFGVQSVGETFTLGVVVYWIILIATYSIDYYGRYQKEELRASRLETELAQAQLGALKMQLQPHFIFNTLHSLSDLVLEDAEAATRMITRLGDFLRLTIESTATQIIPLQQELNFLNCYLEIERVRFQDRLQVDIAVDPDAAAAQVPNLILQPIVENAIRHGISGRVGASRIGIAIQRRDAQLQIRVSDDGPGLTSVSSAAGAGLGLTNTRQRLRHLYGDESSLDLFDDPEGGTIAMLSIPFSKPAVMNKHPDPA